MRFLWAYLNATKSDHDPLLVIAKEHEKAKKKYSVASQATVFRRELNLPEALEPENEVPTVYARNVKQKAKHQAQVQLQQKWEDKSMHGKYPKRVNEKDVDHQMTNQWLKSDGPKFETEGLIIAAQDQAIKTNCYRRNILIPKRIFHSSKMAAVSLFSPPTWSLWRHVNILYLFVSFRVNDV